ncbi:MAG TPA: O-antigen ligase family protein, partial [Solirubrobacteraceae bacterium]|nr:O-antigen ligase family protein [Solirubrobacteraceae bacterium]
MTREPLVAVQSVHPARTVPVRRTQSRLSLTEPTLLAGMAACLAALVIGVSAGVAPKTVLEASIGAIFVALIMSDITMGLMCFGLLAFFDNLPGVGSVSAAKAAGTLVALSWLATIAVRPAARRGFFGAHSRLAATILLLLAWMALSLTWAASASTGVGEIGRYALNLLLLPIIYAAIRNRDHARWLIVVLVAGATLSALYGIVFARGDALAQGTTRLAGAGEDANSEAMLLVAGIALAAALASIKEFSATARIAAMVAGLIQLVALVDTVSRGGLVGLAAVTVLGIAFAGRRRRLPLALTALAGGLCLTGYYLSVASPAARARITTISSSSSSGRNDIWTVAWRMVQAHPLNGVGVGNFTNTSVHYLFQPGAIPSSKYIVDTPEVAHNIYLQILAETGVVGLFLFLCLVGGALWCGVQAARAFARSG